MIIIIIIIILIIAIIIIIIINDIHIHGRVTTPDKPIMTVDPN